MKKLLFILILSLIACTAVFADVQSSRDSGLNWLLSKQNTDGSFGNQTDLMFRDTEETLITLNILNQKGSQYQNGLQWIINNNANNIDSIARKILVFSNEGIDTTAAINKLLSNQNIDGGWGLAVYESDSLDTALTIQALKAASYSNQTVIQSALSYLLSAQNTDGGWGFYQGDDSNIYMTAVVSITLQQFPMTTALANSVNKATDYLRMHQNADGGFASNASTVYETSLAYIALVGVTTDNTMLSNAVNYLIANQLSNGSWNDDPYSTALALRALYFSENKPVSPPQPPTEIIPPVIEPLPSDSTITGKIIDASTGAYLPYADVSLVGTTLTTKTDSTGTYAITGITALTFTVTATATGYNSYSYNVTTTSYGTYAVDFVLGQSQASDLRFTAFTTDKQSYRACENVLITATIENTGSTAISTIIQAQVNDNQGTTIALTTPENLYPPSGPFWVITVEPLSSVTVPMVWNTDQFAPGDHKINLKAMTPVRHGTIFIPGSILAERGLPINIQPSVGITNSAVKFDPTLVYTGSTTPLTVGLTVTNQSNIPADLIIQYDIKSPSGAVLTSGSTPATLSLDTITTTIPLTLLNYTFIENGEYIIHVVVYNDGVMLSEFNAVFVVLSNIRIEPTRTVIPNVLLPNRTGKVTTTIQLSGKGGNTTTPHPAPSAIQVPPNYKVELFASGLSLPLAIKVNAKDELYVASAKDRILKVTPDGTVSIFVSSSPGFPIDFMPGWPTRMDYDKDGNLYVGCVGSYDDPYNPYGDGLDTIYKITPDGMISVLARWYISPNIFYDISGVAVSPDGQRYLLVGDTWTPHDILKIDLTTKTSTKFATSVYSPFDLLFDQLGNLYAVMSLVPREKLNIYRFAADGTRTMYNDSIPYPIAMAWGPDGQLYVLSRTEVYTIDPTTRVATVFATGFTDPYDLDFDSKGTLYVAEYQSGQIIRISKTAAIFTDVRLTDTIPTKDTQFVLSSATKSPYSVTLIGDTTVVEWRYDSITAGQDQTISYDLNLSNLIPGEDRIVDKSLQLIYTDLNSEEITVNLSALTVHVSTSAFDGSVFPDKLTYQANENGVLSATIKNMNDHAMTIDVAVVIEDNYGNPIQTVLTLQGVIFAAGETKSYANLVFQTDLYYAGNYRAHLILSENQIQVGEAIASFTIQPTTDPTSASAITANVTVDQVSYNPNQMATLTSTVNSKSINTIMKNLSATLTIAGSEGNTLYTEIKPINTLMPGALLTFKTYWNTAANPSGTYTVALEVIEGATMISTSQVTFEIIGSSNTGSGLVGTITAAPNPIYQGNTETLTYNVTNKGNENIPNLNTKIIIVDPDTKEVKIEFTSQGPINISETIAGIQTASTAVLPAKIYLAILQAFTPEMTEPLTLASATFEVKPALEATKKIPDITNLLVWINDGCHNHEKHDQCDGWDGKHKDQHDKDKCDSKHDDKDKDNECKDNHKDCDDNKYSDKHDDKCDNEHGNKCNNNECKDNHNNCDDSKCSHHKKCIRQDLLENILKETVTSYLIVKDKKDLEKELRNPYYTDIIILGEHHPIEDHHINELKEQIYSGKGIIASLYLKHGWYHDNECSHDQKHDNLFGIKYKGQLSGDNHQIELLHSPISEPDVLDAKGKANEIEANNINNIIAWIEGDKHHHKHKKPEQYPAIVLNTYGLGKTIYYAFDLGLTLDETNYTKLKDIIKNSITYIHKPQTQTTFQANQLIPVEIQIKSLGSAFNLKLTETYPQEIKIYNPLTGNWITNNPWEITETLPANETKTTLYYALMPNTIGTYTLKTDIGYIENNTYNLYQTLSLDINVDKNNTILASDIITALNALTVSHHDKHKLRNAIEQIEKVQKRTIKGKHDIEQNIHDMLTAIDSLISITSADTSNARLMMDRLLKSWEGKWFLM